ncbi:MAG: phosphatase PAP2 family protein [Bacteroidetes bacterium]|nr:phosphatase PAP2 family protein [Bacteroidota bacterium]
MIKINKLISVLSPIDFIVVVFYLFLTAVNLIFMERVTNWQTLIIMNAGILSIVFGLAYFSEKKNHPIITHLRYWYLIPLIFITFKELYYLAYPIHGVDYDTYLIAIDRFIFGFDPTVALYKIANPYLTELLQIVYGTFFFLPVLLAADLLMNSRWKELEYHAFIIVFGFILSYTGYLFFPAVGPRFTLHDFTLLNEQLPGLFLTNYLRDIVNAGESIKSGAVDAVKYVQRDVFPSGHTQMTILVMYLSWKFKTKTRWFFLVTGSLLVFSTVYLRYHYVVDVLGGFVFVVLTLWLGKHIFNWWKGVRKEEKFDLSSY